MGFGGKIYRNEDYYVLFLDKYERDNLLCLLAAVEQVEKLSILNNGDWVGQIADRLTHSWPRQPATTDRPNVELTTLIKHFDQE